MNASYQETALFESRFWLQIMGDHARFIKMSLGPEETAEINRAEHFIGIFDNLLAKVRQQNPEVMELLTQSLQYTEELRAFKLHLLTRHLTGKINIHLPPTFINHMVNELEEFLLVLSYLLRQELPLFNPVHHHMLWTLDGVGHAATITSTLDIVEKDVIMKARAFEKDFTDLYLKSVEFCGYMRTSLHDFPALTRLNSQADMKFKAFMAFLKELQALRLSKKLLGTLAPLALDHMFREECYYLTKVAQVSEVEKPDCDPTKPRLEA